MTCPMKKLFLKCPFRKKLIKSSLSLLQKEWKSDESLDFQGFSEELWQFVVEVHPLLAKEHKAKIANLLETYGKEVDVMKEIFPPELQRTLEKTISKSNK